MISKGRIILLILMTVAMIMLWDYPFLGPFKVFVVFLHEISHGLGAIFTGGSVKSVAVYYNESGSTTTVQGNFLAIASAGYLGSILWGSVMLNSALKDKWLKAISIIIGALFLLFTVLFLEESFGLVFFTGLAWGLAFIMSGFLYKKLNRFLLFVMGGLTSLYGLYDLGDFFRGEVMATDAGIIANHYLKGSGMSLPLAYAIAILISLLSIWLLYRIIHSALHVDHHPEEEAEVAPVLPEGITPEMLALFQQMSQVNQPGPGKEE